MAYRDEGSRSGAMELARGLGWFSIALGIAEVAMPRTLARNMGMEGSEALLQAYGLREIMTGIGILSTEDPTPWIWGRVAGDALDAATLAPALTGDNPQREGAMVAMAAVAGAAALDLYCAQALSAEREPPQIHDYSDRSGFPQGLGRARGTVTALESDAYAHQSAAGVGGDNNWQPGV